MSTRFMLATAIATASAFAAKTTWEPIAPADLAATVSASAPGADLEILFSHSRMDANSSSTYVTHHIQAKIYTQKGVERTSVFGFEHQKKQKIWNTVGRVVKPDGSSVELTKADFHETVAVKSGGYEIVRMTFAFPNVQPGDVLEYRWTEALPDTYGYYKHYCQAEDVPTREYTFETTRASNDFTVMWFNCGKVEHKPKSQKVVIYNLPPFIKEPLMPTDTEFRGWIVILFTSPYQRFYTNDDAWTAIGDYIAEEFRLDIAPNGAVRTKAAQLIAGATTPGEKISRLYTFAQTEIKNLDFEENASLAAPKKKRDAEDKFQTPGKTLERGSGKSGDINRLFAGLARASGFDVRYAMSADRSEVLTIKRLQGWTFADRSSVAVKLGERWKFFTPGYRLVPAGLLDSKDEAAVAFVCDEKKSWFDTTQIAAPDQTALKRRGRFVLDDEGTLDGDVDIQMTGHRAIRARDNWIDRSDEESTKSVREALVQRLATAEVSDVRCENLFDVSTPFQSHYHVHVPGYAETIGSRLALPLNFFEANAPLTFTNDTRRYPIFFDFATAELDDVEIVIPPGFALDGASAPAPVGKVGDPISARYTVKYLPKTRTLAYTREHVVGAGGTLAFRAESYAPLRDLDERIHRSDVHQLVLKPKAAAPTVAPITTPTASSSQ